MSAVKFILPSGEVRSGAHAVFTALASVPDRRWVLGSYERFPGVAPLCEAAYRTIAGRRPFGYWATRLLRGIPLRPETYHVTSWVFLRLLGAIYLLAFASFGVQAAALVGLHGILPASEFLGAVHQSLGTAAYWNVPTLLWLNRSDVCLLQKKETGHGWEQRDDISMVDFRCTEYSDGRVVADKEMRKQIVAMGIRKVARKAGIRSDTITLIARGNPVRRVTLAKIRRILG